jgi:dTDP-4-dehydrorhamnose 3,5-epimerase-like enzyme
MNKTSINDCSIINLPQIKDRRGSISPVNSGIEIPFEVKRVFYIYDIPGGEDRGAHAHKECHQFLVAVSGSFEVEIDDGTNRKTVVLNRPYFGLHVPPGIWAAEQSFSGGAICLVLTSHEYNASDYIRSYNSYLDYISLNS